MIAVCWRASRRQRDVASRRGGDYGPFRKGLQTDIIGLLAYGKASIRFVSLT
jgi:hypothetical protein